MLLTTKIPEFSCQFVTFYRYLFRLAGYNLDVLSQGEKIDEDALSGDAFEDAPETEILTADALDSDEVGIF